MLVKIYLMSVRFEVLTEMTMRTAFFWDVRPCSFGGISLEIYQAVTA